LKGLLGNNKTSFNPIEPLIRVSPSILIKLEIESLSSFCDVKVNEMKKNKKNKYLIDKKLIINVNTMIKLYIINKEIIIIVT